MASTLKKQDGATDMAVSTSVITDQCIAELFAGNLKAASAYRMFLLDLTQGTLTITPTGTAFQFAAAMSNAECATVAGKYTKGTGISLATPVITALSNHAQTLDFDDASIAFTGAETIGTDGYYIARWVTSLADSPVLAIGKFSARKTPVGVTLSIPIAGVIKFTASDAA
jgi:hypothetical protein